MTLLPLLFVVVCAGLVAVRGLRPPGHHFPRTFPTRQPPIVVSPIQSSPSSSSAAGDADQDLKLFQQFALTCDLSQPVIQFPNDIKRPIPFLTQGVPRASTYFVRDFHRLMPQMMDMSPRGCIFLGQPGISKSYSGIYLAIDAIRRGNAVVFHSARTGFMYVFTPDWCELVDSVAKPKWLHVVLNSVDTLYIYDGITGMVSPPLLSSCKAAILTSPNINAYKQAEREGCIRIAVPSWSLDELLAVRDYFDSSEVDVERKYKKFGGSMRYVFGLDETVGDDAIASAVARFDPDKLNDYVEGTTQRAMASEGNPSVLFCIDAKTSSPSDKLLDTYKYSNAQWRFVNDDVAQQVYQRHKDHVEKWACKCVYMLSPSALGPVAGKLLETVIGPHVARGGAFKVRKLNPSGTRRANQQATAEEIWKERKVEYKRGVQTIEQLLSQCTDEDTVYCMMGTFPAFDMFIPPNVFLQVTRNAEHTIHYETAVKATKWLEEKGMKLEYYIAAPSSEVDDFVNERAFKSSPVKEKHSKPSSGEQGAAMVKSGTKDSGADGPLQLEYLRDRFVQKAVFMDFDQKGN